MEHVELFVGLCLGFVIASVLHGLLNRRYQEGKRDGRIEAVTESIEREKAPVDRREGESTYSRVSRSIGTA